MSVSTVLRYNVDNSMKRLATFLRTNKRVRQVLVIVGCIFALFLLINLVLFVVYKNRTYPATKLQGQKVGSVSRTSLESKLGTLDLLPETFRFVYQDKELDLNTEDVGVSIDKTKTSQNAISQRSWLPIVNFFSKPQPDVVLSFDIEKFTLQSTKLEETFQAPPTDAKITLANGAFTLTPETQGYSLDEGPLRDAVQLAVNSGNNEVDVPVRVVDANVKQADLSANFEDLKARGALSLQYRFGNQNRILNAAEIAALHEQSGSTFVVSDAKIRNQIVQVGRGFGIGVLNINETMAATKNSLELKKNLDFVLKEAPLKTYTYCTSVRGVDASELAGLNAKLAAVFADRRGWSADGKVGFVYVESGCNFRVWLSAAAQVPSFSPIVCSAEWSCAVPPNVIINFDRWRGASAAWNQAGGSLEDYRSMVINHETGHWLGFGHRNCGGAGQAAPVMQQQSIDLQGCTFNPWPTASEVASLKAAIGI